MATVADQIRHYLEQTEASGAAREEFIHFLKGLKPKELTDALALGTRKSSSDLLGWLIVPALSEVLVGPHGIPDQFFDPLLDLLGDVKASEALRGVVMDFLDGAPRSPTQDKAYRERLRTIVSNRRQPSELRAQALAGAVPSLDAEAVKLLDQFLDSKDRWLSDAAYHVLTHLHRVKAKIPSHLLAKAARHAQSRGKSALERPAVLKALGELDTKETRAALRALARAATTPQHRAALIGASDGNLELELLAELIREAMRTHSVYEVNALRGVLAEHPTLPEKLDRAGFHPEYLFLSRLHSNAQRPGRILALTGDPAPSTADDARRVGGLLPANEDLSHLQENLFFPGVGPVPKETFIKALKERSLVESGMPRKPDQRRLPAKGRRRPHPVPPAPPTPTGPFVTGMHLGDALYRDLILPADHWHAGIYLGFHPDADGTAHLQAVNASNWPGDAIVIADAWKSFASPSIDVAGGMRELKAAFIRAYQEGHTDKKVYEARTIPGITARQRQSVAATASAFMHKNIWWCWANMMRPPLIGSQRWDGTLRCVAASRCDGVVEWSYEFNELRVSNGKDGSLWKIAASGKKHASNHNHFHVEPGVNKPGMLCPRIQAGDQGDHRHRGPKDTTFVIDQVSAPTITDYEANGFALIFPPSVFFKVAAPAYHTVYAWLTVRKDKDHRPVDFALTEDPYGKSGALVGSWRFMEVPANRNDRSFAWWLGKTAGGLNYSGQNGDYIFQLVVIDPGGNVSAAATKTAHIEWPSAAKPAAKPTDAGKPATQVRERVEHLSARRHVRP